MACPHDADDIAAHPSTHPSHHAKDKGRTNPPIMADVYVLPTRYYYYLYLGCFAIWW